MNRFLLAAMAFGGLTLATGCETEATGPEEEGTAEVVSAVVSINGRTLAETDPPRHGDLMRIEAQVSSANPSLIHQTVVDHTGPGAKMGRVTHAHALMLYDDGTHGDHRPGDGIYCHEGDFAGMLNTMGQLMSRMAGMHTFAISVQHMDGSHSAPYEVTLKVR